MNGTKVGFIFYFDSYPAMASLPVEQRGWLITALCVYADRVWREETDPEDLLEQFPHLDAQGAAVFRLIAAGIRRDTEKWLAAKSIRARRTQDQASAAPSARPQKSSRSSSAKSPSPGCYAPFPFRPDPVRADPEQVARAHQQILSILGKAPSPQS